MKRIALLVLVVVVAAAGFGVWFYLIRDDAPPEAALPERETTESTEVDDPTGGTTGETSGAATGDTADGSWSIATGEELFAGFRIVEHFAIDNTAVVRTQEVTASLTVDGSTISEATVEVDVTSMQSEDSVPPGVPGIGNRMDQMRNDGLETDSFPTATFTLTAPIELDAAPAIGEAVTAVAVGDLTIHGVTQAVEIPIEARWSGDLIDVAGSLDIVLADYGMDAPVRPFVTVDENGTLEFQLVFTRDA